MGVNQTQTLESCGGCTENVEAWNKYAFVVSENDHADLAFTVNQQTDLPVESAGKKGYLTGQVIAENAFRRDAAAIKTFQRFDLLGAQPRCIAEYLINGKPSLPSCVPYS
jgi:hypothetical protein